MRENILRALLLVAGLACLVLASGTHALAWAPFAANALLLVFVDRSPARNGLLILFPLYLAAFCVGWFGVLPNAPLFLYAAIAFVYGVPYFLPFVVHRLFKPAEAPHWLYTLAFPCAYVAVEYALRLFSPYGSWMSLAYSQDAGGAIGQLASLAGMGAVTFFLCWTSSLGAWVVACAHRGASGLATGLVPAAILVALAVWGGYRSAATDPSRAIIVASVLPNYDLQDASQNAVPDDTKPIAANAAQRERSADDALNHDLLARSAQRAAAGAKIVAWPEGAGLVRDADEPTFLAEAGAAARDGHMYLLASYIVWHPRQPKPIENKVVAFAPDGRILAQYRKGHPIVGFEDVRAAAGNRVPAIIDTPYGRIAFAICHDLDFPEFMRPAIDAHVDLFIAPSNDWPEIGELHANMHGFRAVEGGFAMLRPASRGVSDIANARGRVLAQTTTFRSGQGDLMFAAPVGRTPTLYAVVGDVLVWVSLGLLVLLAIARFRRSPPRGRSEAKPA